MGLFYKELDFRSTPIGDLMLRRRRMPQLEDCDIYEVKLGEDFLMTSLFHEAESQLAKLGLSALKDSSLDVMVGGLGLGYTAAAALEDGRVGSLVVVEYLEGVLEWHKTGLVPLGQTLMDDPRCQLMHADFFALMREMPTKKYDAILLDIDHTPTHVLHQSNTHFYTESGLEELKQHLKPNGIFSLWADGMPEEEFTHRLTGVFSSAEAHTIEFPNPVTGGSSKGAVYVARTNEP